MNPSDCSRSHSPHLSYLLTLQITSYVIPQFKSLGCFRLEFRLIFVRFPIISSYEHLSSGSWALYMAPMLTWECWRCQNFSVRFLFQLCLFNFRYCFVAFFCFWICTPVLPWFAAIFLQCWSWLPLEYWSCTPQPVSKLLCWPCRWAICCGLQALCFVPSWIRTWGYMTYFIITSRKFLLKVMIS